MLSLVTGGAGFIGSHVVRHCLKLGHTVIVLDDLTGGFRENVPELATFIHGSVVDRNLTKNIFREKHIDYVYHLAAYAAEGLSHFIRYFNYENNLLGTINLINEAVRHDVRCFVFTSSIAVYGAGQLPMTEDQTPTPEDPYGISKYAAELDLQSAHRMFGLNFIIFRPHNVFGEHQNINDRYRNVIGIFMNQLIRHEPMTIFGDGTQTRAFSYIDDVAPYIACSPEVPSALNETFNIGADNPASVLELANTVARVFRVEPRIEFLPPRSEVLHAFADHSKVRRVFRPAEPVSVEDGLGRMAEWVKKQAVPREPSRFGRIEIARNMPASWLHSTEMPR
jgi:UDP-glucose 4-epimerase